MPRLRPRVQCETMRLDVRRFYSGAGPPRPAGKTGALAREVATDVPLSGSVSRPDHIHGVLGLCQTEGRRTLAHPMSHFYPLPRSMGMHHGRCHTGAQSRIAGRWTRAPSMSLMHPSRACECSADCVGAGGWASCRAAPLWGLYLCLHQRRHAPSSFSSNCSGAHHSRSVMHGGVWCAGAAADPPDGGHVHAGPGGQGLAHVHRAPGHHRRLPLPDAPHRRCGAARSLLCLLA